MKVINPMKIRGMLSGLWKRTAASLPGLGVCLLVMAGIVLSGCSERYVRERLFWKAERAAAPILRSRGGVATYEFNRVVGLFQRVIEISGDDSGYGFNAHLRIAQLRASQGEFDKAQALLDELIDNQSKRQERIPAVLYQKGQIYEAAGAWPQALGVYRRIIAVYPESQEAISLPLYIARYYTRQGDRIAAAQAYQASIEYFTAMALRYPDSQTGRMAEHMVVRTYMEIDDWQKAVSFIEELESDGRLDADILFLLGRLYETRFQDAAKARSAYERVIELWPQDRLAGLARQRLKALP